MGAGGLIESLLLNHSSCAAFPGRSRCILEAKWSWNLVKVSGASYNWPQVEMEGNSLVTTDLGHTKPSLVNKGSFMPSGKGFSGSLAASRAARPPPHSHGPRGQAALHRHLAAQSSADDLRKKTAPAKCPRVTYNLRCGSHQRQWPATHWGQNTCRLFPTQVLGSLHKVQLWEVFLPDAQLGRRRAHRQITGGLIFASCLCT